MPSLRFIDLTRAEAFGRLLEPIESPKPCPSGLGWVVEHGEPAELPPEAGTYVQQQLHHRRISAAAGLRALTQALHGSYRPFYAVLDLLASALERAPKEVNEVLGSDHLALFFRTLAGAIPDSPPEMPDRRAFLLAAASLLDPHPPVAPYPRELILAAMPWQQIMAEADKTMRGLPLIQRNDRGEFFRTTPGGLSEAIGPLEVEGVIAQHRDCVGVITICTDDIRAYLGAAGRLVLTYSN